MQLSLLPPPTSSSSLENMEFSEEVMGTAQQETSFAIVKGKRSKRQRLLHPMTSSSSTGGAGCEDGDDDENENDNQLPSPATSAHEHSEATTEEDEDMANCLILLAQGQTRDGANGADPAVPEAAPPTRADNESFYVYECKTCNRCFPSFQALGGHRASHKRPKPAEEKKILEDNRLDSPLFNKQPPPHNKSRVHECSICGAEFSSGQALGGHMRRHRTAAMADGQESRKQRSILELDLNLPAPQEDDAFVKSPPPRTGFSLTRLATAPTLVDCHY